MGTFERLGLELRPEPPTLSDPCGCWVGGTIRRTGSRRRLRQACDSARQSSPCLPAKTHKILTRGCRAGAPVRAAAEARLAGPMLEPAQAARALPPAAKGTRAVRVAVIGAGIVGVTTAFELAADGHRGHGVRAPCQRGQRNQLRQCRRDGARLRHALGRAGHAAEGVAATCSARHAPVRFGGMSAACPPAVDVALVARLPAGRVPGQPRPHVRPGPLQQPAPAGFDARA